MGEQFYEISQDKDIVSSLSFVDPDKIKFELFQFNSIPVSDSWEIVELEYLDRDHRGKKRSRMDFTPLALSISVNADVRERLAPLFDDYGEFLPILVEGNTHYVYHVTNVVDCASAEDCEGRYFSSGECPVVTKWVFRSDALEGHDILVPSLSPFDYFFSQKTVDFIEELGLTGLIYKPVSILPGSPS